MKEKDIREEYTIESIVEKIKSSEMEVIGVKRHFSVFIPLVWHEPTIKGKACDKEDKSFANSQKELCMLLEVRSINIKRQPGEICFPGGMVEEGEDYKRAAIRETCEELGVKPSDVRVLTEFDPLVNYSGFTIHCYVGTIGEEALSRLEISKDEVSEVFYVPIAGLKEAQTMGKSETINYSEPVVQIKVEVPLDFPYEQLGFDNDYYWRVGKMEIPIYEYGNYEIWGITGRIIKQFLKKSL